MRCFARPAGVLRPGQYHEERNAFPRTYSPRKPCRRTAGQSAEEAGYRSAHLCLRLPALEKRIYPAAALGSAYEKGMPALRYPDDKKTHGRYAPPLLLLRKLPGALCLIS